MSGFGTKRVRALPPFPTLPLSIGYAHARSIKLIPKSVSENGIAYVVVGCCQESQDSALGVEGSASTHDGSNANLPF